MIEKGFPVKKCFMCHKSHIQIPKSGKNFSAAAASFVCEHDIRLTIIGMLPCCRTEKIEDEISKFTAAKSKCHCVKVQFVIVAIISSFKNQACFLLPKTSSHHRQNCQNCLNFT